MKSMKEILLTIIKNKETRGGEFRQAAAQPASLLAIQVGFDIPLVKRQIQPPLALTEGVFCEPSSMLLSILRSGISMLHFYLVYFRHATVDVVGLKRDEEADQPHLYYLNLPPLIPHQWVINLDLMIKLHVAVQDERLNQYFFIMPGLRDFRDRYFGTL